MIRPDHYLSRDRAKSTSRERLLVVVLVLVPRRFGVRRQSAAATALWLASRRLWKRRPRAGRVHSIQSGVTLRFPPHCKTLARASSPRYPTSASQIHRWSLAPRRWPKKSLSASPGWIAAQLTVTNGPWLRFGSSRWIARARSSLPVPLSPVMRTGRSLKLLNQWVSVQVFWGLDLLPRSGAS